MSGTKYHGEIRSFWAKHKKDLQYLWDTILSDAPSKFPNLSLKN